MRFLLLLSMTLCTKAPHTLVWFHSPSRAGTLHMIRYLIPPSPSTLSTTTALPLVCRLMAHYRIVEAIRMEIVVLWFAMKGTFRRGLCSLHAALPRPSGMCLLQLARNVRRAIFERAPCVAVAATRLVFLVIVGLRVLLSLIAPALLASMTSRCIPSGEQNAIGSVKQGMRIGMARACRYPCLVFFFRSLSRTHQNLSTVRFKSVFNYQDSQLNQ